MSTKIRLVPDNTIAGYEELVDDIRVELSALDIGEVTEETEKATEGKLGLDLVTIAVIIGMVSGSIDIIKAVISVVKEVQLRYADRKKVDLENVPKVILTLEDNEGKPTQIEIPGSKVAETRFLNEAKLKKGINSDA